MSTPTERPPGDTGPGLFPDSNPRNLLPAATYDSVVGTVLDSNPGMDVETARRITGEGIKFTVTAAMNPGLPMAPSRTVDEGWHALILHTAPYAALCAQFGEFVHHYPGYDPDNHDPDVMNRTVRAIGAAGFEVDTGLWRAPTDAGLVSVAANCAHSPCNNTPIQPMPTPQPLPSPRKD
ncbi:MULTISPECIES: hypothetical protein [Kitasatospora]|uniref:Uncharacterized protein n=1 Tax=Kitasatospora setae (strain ATCC 33774 / DSM 43861 / JCM 3304 / KCC A-0304 / NBRC 14216 / KM-6054) TaxID=452652 RepID=E4NAK0_KITSK|nr:MULTISPECIES: hypothetical protein [Kitasatospora]BAJ28231.1 hypothetical protein KSE_24140 [Kitasatospora setae KM-6054]